MIYNKGKILVYVSYSVAILGIVFFEWRGQSAIRQGGDNALYRNLMEGRTWIRRGFDPANIQKLPEAGRDWYFFENRPLRVMDSPLPGLPKRPFLSPWGRGEEEFTIMIALELDAAALAALDPPGKPALTPGLFFAFIGENWEIFLNGALLRSEMHLEGGKIRSSRTWRDVYFPVDRHILKEGPNTLALRIIGDPAYGGTGLYYAAPFYLDDYMTIERRQLNLLTIALCGVFGFIGIYYLVRFFSLRRNREFYNLCYSIFSLLLCFYTIARSGVMVNRLIPNSSISSRLEYAASFLMISILGLFLESLGRRRITKITWAYTGLCLFLCLTLLTPCSQFHDDVLKIWNICTLLYLPYLLFYNIIYFYFSLRRENRMSDLSSDVWAAASISNIMIGAVMVFICGVIDLLDVLFFHYSFNFFRYSSFVLHIGIVFTLSGRLNELYRRLERSNATLETAVHERTLELEKQTGIAIEASRAKSEFLAAMSHEIRTPLNAVIGLSEIELRGNPPPKSKENIEQIYQSGSTLLGIVNDILDISKIEAGGLELIPVEYETAPFINDTVHLNIVRIGAKPIVFVLEIDSGFPRKLRGDELRVKQVLNNILSNAFKYTREGKVTLSAVWEDRGKEALLRFAVRDTGKGIRQEDIGKLFSNYSQLDTRANRKIEGTGLGLAITKRLVEMMGGRITLESEYKKGSVFTVELLQDIVDKAPIGEETAKSLMSFRYVNAGKERNLIRAWIPHGSVLVVDDLETNLYVASGLLSPYGLSIETAGSGGEALEKIRSGRSYDVIFMDHMMPGMDGVEAAAKIRDLGYTGTIIALTANAISGQAERFLQNGFDDYISKPIDTRQLDRALHKWVKNKHPGEIGEINEAIEETPNSGLTSGPRSNVPVSNSFPGLLLHDIPGVNTAQGIALTGGSVALYQQVLAIFRKDAEERLPLLREIPAPETLPLFTTQVHALKSASASIGAARLSVEAAQLEAAGKAGDLSLIAVSLPGFAARLAELTQGIRVALDEDAPDAAPAENSPIPAIIPRLHELGEALKAQNTVAIDRILEELGQGPMDSKTKQSLEQISDHVLLADFDAALETLKTL